MKRALLVLMSFLFLILPGHSWAVETLHLYNWDDYLEPELIAKFEKETGIKIEQTTYADEDEMLSTITGDPGRFDLVITSQELVRQLRIMRMLAPINRNKIPNMDLIAPRFQNTEFDKGNEYSIPYLWGTTGIVYNKEFIKEVPQGWEVLWDQRYTAHIGMMSTAFENMGIALHLLGASSNTDDDKVRRAAGEKLLEQHSLGVSYAGVEELKKMLASGKVWVTPLYTSDALELAEADPRFVYIFPSQSFDLWFDNFCIPRDTGNKELAERFINFMLVPENAARNANFLYTATCNLSARELLRKQGHQDARIYPPPEVVDRAEFYGIFKDEDHERRVNQINNRYWATLQTMGLKK